jgi:hypothetical protein
MMHILRVTKPQRPQKLGYWLNKSNLLPIEEVVHTGLQSASHIYSPYSRDALVFYLAVTVINVDCLLLNPVLREATQVTNPLRPLALRLQRPELTTSDCPLEYHAPSWSR